MAGEVDGLLTPGLYKTVWLLVKPPSPGAQAMDFRLRGGRTDRAGELLSLELSRARPLREQDGRHLWINSAADAVVSGAQPERAAAAAAG